MDRLVGPAVMPRVGLPVAREAERAEPQTRVDRLLVDRTQVRRAGQRATRADPHRGDGDRDRRPRVAAHAGTPSGSAASRRSSSRVRTSPSGSNGRLGSPASKPRSRNPAFTVTGRPPSTMNRSSGNCA